MAGIPRRAGKISGLARPVERPRPRAGRACRNTLERPRYVYCAAGGLRVYDQLQVWFLLAKP